MTMKTIRRTLLTMITLMLLPIGLSAQKSEAGMNIGFGKTITDDSRIAFVLPFEGYAANYFRLGFDYFYHPKDAIFTLSTGINYSYKGKNTLNLHYLRPQMGLDFIFGKEIRFIFGGGFYVSYLFAYGGTSNMSNRYDFEHYHNRFQLGWYGNVGIAIRITPKFNLSVKYQNNADITPMFTIKRYSPGGSPYDAYDRGFDGLIVIGLTQHLIKK